MSWINWFIRNKIAMWAGLNWLIKDSVALIACIVAKGTKGGGKKERQMPVRGIHAHQPQTGRLSSSETLGQSSQSPTRKQWSKFHGSSKKGSRHVRVRTFCLVLPADIWTQTLRVRVGEDDFYQGDWVLWEEEKLVLSWEKTRSRRGLFTVRAGSLEQQMSC